MSSQLDLFEPERAPRGPWRAPTIDELELEAERASRELEAYVGQWGATDRAARMAFNIMCLFGAVDELRRRQDKDRSQ